MVKALHRAGIEVILDVVFNHTAEGDHTRADALLPRPRQPDLLHPRRRTARATPTTRGYGNTLNANHPDRPPHDRGQPALLGRGDARRWLPLRPGLDPGARRVGPAAAEPAGALGHRVGPGAGRHEADRRGVGRGRAVPGRQLRRRQLEGMERPLPRRRPRLLPRRATASVDARRRPAGRQPRDLRPQGARGRAERQLRDLPRRLHAQRPRLLQPASTTRRTARTTATAPTTTGAGTAASRARPTIRPSRRCATAR